MQQLLSRDLMPGDVLLKIATNSFIHTLIKLGQRLTGQPNAFLGHAAIALDTQFAIEAQKQGVTANHLAMKNKDAGYYVYRCANAALGRGAATCAKMFFDIVQAGGKMKFNWRGAFTQALGGRGDPKTAAKMDALLDELLEGSNHPFFCSQFVVYVYQLSAYQSGIPAKNLFDISDAKVSPSALASLLQGNPWFREVGYMLPNER